MYNMFSMANGFPEWLNVQLEERSWTFRELARRSELSVATISNVISGTTNPGLHFCVGVARALGERPEVVLRIAGLLPSLPEAVAEEEECLAIYRELPAGDRRTVLAMVRGLYGRHRPLPAVGEESVPYTPEPDPIDTELRAKAEELIAIWRELRDTDPEAGQRLVNIAVLQAEMVQAAARARQTTDDGVQQTEEEKVDER